MNATAQYPLNPPIFDVPEPPQEFGQDGGRFYRCYDAIADEIDDDMTQGLKEQLDGMLIFAGLFAGVNSAFLALTLPLLSADPADDTNALLAQNNAILMQLLMGKNDSVPANPVLPSTEFSPSHDIFTVNTLFSLSLAFAIISSFLAMLGRQWLVYYRKRGGGGPDARRWTQLKRYLGAERWGLEPILDDVLPSLLQIGLIIFCASLILYLRHLSPTISLIVGIPMYLGLAFFVGSGLCIIWDKFCPFHSPLSHLMLLTLPWVRGTARFITAFLTPNSKWRYHYRYKVQRFKKQVLHLPFAAWSILRKGREEERLASLQAVALHRTICTSDDSIVLLTAAANVPAITDPVLLKQVLKDSDFTERLYDLYNNPDNKILQFRSYSADISDTTKFIRRLTCSAVGHSIFTAGPGWDFPRRLEYDAQTSRSIELLIPRSLLLDSSPNSIKANLAFYAAHARFFTVHDEERERRASPEPRRALVPLAGGTDVDENRLARRIDVDQNRLDSTVQNRTATKKVTPHQSVSLTPTPYMMNATAHNPVNPPIFDVPEPPQEFGQDGGRFYRCYDAIADEIDEDMTQGLKEQLDGMLIFAGLFAGVNSAFLALTIPLLSADPADDTNALLAQNNAILMQLLMGRNDSVPATPVLPSTEFSPPYNISTINTLFSLSLAFAIISSFLAMLGRQWLVYYRKRGGGGPDARRWTQLKWYLGAERWGLEPILDGVLPSLLQIGLIIFCASLILYLRHLSPTISLIVAIPMYLGLAFFAGSALQDERWRYEYRPQMEDFKRKVLCLPSVWFHIWSRGQGEEDLASLQAAALHRTVCASDDPIVLLTAAANIPAIRDAVLLKQAIEDSSFTERLSNFYRDPDNKMLHVRGSNAHSKGVAMSIRRLSCSAMAHIIFTAGLGFVWELKDGAQMLSPIEILIPRPLLLDSSPNSIKANLAFVAVYMRGRKKPEDAYGKLPAKQSDSQQHRISEL
ncbi:hypothetical protein FRC01_002864 [Tulasnella sp. 417]|nr:hypothetical protein FRC01_002864 [Tulasnella sp. 417]